MQAGKHAFTEKPNGIDADGVHVTIQAAKIAEEKKLANVSGLCYRYDLLRLQAIERIRNGEIGEILAAQSDYLRTPYNLIPKKPEWSEAEYQIRNWEHFTLLNGDEIQQSLLHNLDSVLWALEDELPETCYALGGRSSVFSPALGDLFDHAAVIYDYADGKRIYGATRTAPNCLTSNIDVFHGTQGRMVFNATGISFMTDTRGNVRWRPEPKDQIRSISVRFRCSAHNERKYRMVVFCELGVQRRVGCQHARSASLEWQSKPPRNSREATGQALVPTRQKPAKKKQNP